MDEVRVLGELEVAHEELRVAEEELRQQQAQIEELVVEHLSGRRWRDHLLASLPIGVLLTGPDGMIREVNPAAAELLNVRPDRLVGKPLPAFVEGGDRRSVRGLLARLAEGATEDRVTVRLRPRALPPRPADLVALGQAGDGTGGVRWILVPGDQPGPGNGATAGDDAASGGGRPEEDELRTATALARLYTLPVGEFDRRRLLSQMALALRSAVRPTASAVSITLGSPLEPESAASDSTEAQQFDWLQLRLGEGPCVDAYEQQRIVVAADVGQDARWPRLAAEARRGTLRGVLAVPLHLGQKRAGVVNVYASGTQLSPQRAERIGELVAAVVAAVLEVTAERAALQSLVQHLERALGSRAVIEQAKGVVMAHQHCTADEAFAKLIALSSRTNVKLRDIAAAVVGGTGRVEVLRNLR